MDHNVGDLVRLRSGGPTMTVASLEERRVLCIWFSTDNEVATGLFPPGVLKNLTSSQPIAEAAE
jgi:uncharacterized protein YodC (DUF2158 family)